MKEYVIYSGEKFTVEWFYNEQDTSDAKKYFDDLSDSQKRKFLVLVERLGQFGTISNKQKFRNEGDKIYAFKPKPDRFLCFFFKDGKVIVTNAFEKKQDKLPRTEKERALQRMNDYINRIEKSTYYD